MSDWLAIGPPGNWEIGLKNQLWAFPLRMAKRWNEIQPGDRLFFYATAPVKGVIGFGLVEKIQQAGKPFWPQEKKEGEILWPFQVRLGKVLSLPRADWESKHVPVGCQQVVFQCALQSLQEKVARKIAEALKR